MLTVADQRLAEEVSVARHGLDDVVVELGKSGTAEQRHRRRGQRIEHRSVYVKVRSIDLGRRRTPTTSADFNQCSAS